MTEIISEGKFRQDLKVQTKSSKGPNTVDLGFSRKTVIVKHEEND